MSDPGDDRPSLLILGASARAAASSAWRAGFAPIAVDLFADRDLAARFPAHHADHNAYPANLAPIAESLPSSPWIYTGALENHPGLIDEIARSRPLLGIAGDTLRAVRNPMTWGTALRAAGVAVLESRLAGDRPPLTGEWLLKPLASASGRGIRRWTLGEGPIPSACQLQARRDGLPLGATFVGNGRSARLIGITRQLLGRSREGLRVVYRGSVGPWPVVPGIEAAIARMGMVLATEFSIRGLFGIDLIVANGIALPVEINPRYSASVEVLEMASGVSIVTDHARAFGIELEPPPIPRTVRVAAKRILFARRHGQAPMEWPWTDPETVEPTVADLPAPGTLLGPGDPVLTVFAHGSTVGRAIARLTARASAWRRRIDGWVISEN